MLDISTVESSVGAVMVGNGSIHPRAFRRRFIRCWHPSWIDERSCLEKRPTGGGGVIDAVVHGTSKVVTVCVNSVDVEISRENT